MLHRAELEDRLPYRFDIDPTVKKFGQYGKIVEINSHSFVGRKGADITVKNVYASGGIPLKNSLLVQIYADVFNKDVYVIDDQYSAALGSAILGVAAADKGGFKKLREIENRYKTTPKNVFHPVRENVETYKELYSIYLSLYEEYGKKSDIMKKLKTIKSQSKNA